MNTSVTALQNRKSLDYSSLSRPVTKAEVGVFRAKQKRIPSRNNLRNILIAVCIGLFFLLLITYVIFSTITVPNGDSGLEILILSSVVFAFIVGIGYALWRKRLKKLVKLDRFARSNNLELLSDVVEPNYNGMIFDEGHSRKISEAIKFPNGSLEVGNYSYVTGSGKNRTTHYFSYVKIPLQRKLPHMVLDSQKNNFFGMSNLPDVYIKDQALSLEGNFDTYFKLYAPKQYERDALYIFTPDVMAVLMDSGQKYDIEVIDDTLYMFNSRHIDLLSKEQLDTVLSIVHKIGSEVSKQSTSYADERVQDRTINTVAGMGQRLKPGVNWIAVSIFLVIFFVYIIDFLMSRKLLG